MKFIEWEHAKKELAYWKEQMKNNGGDSKKWKLSFIYIRYWSYEEFFYRPNRWFDIYGFNHL